MQFDLTGVFLSQTEQQLALQHKYQETNHHRAGTAKHQMNKNHHLEVSTQIQQIKMEQRVSPTLFGNLHLGARLFSCHLPEGLSLPQVVQGEEYVRVLAYAVVGEALQVDQQVMRYWNSARFPMSLSGVVALKHTKKSNQTNKIYKYTYYNTNTTLCEEFMCLGKHIHQSLLAEQKHL